MHTGFQTKAAELLIKDHEDCGILSLVRIYNVIYKMLYSTQASALVELTLVTRYSLSLFFTAALVVCTIRWVSVCLAEHEIRHPS